MRITLNFSRIQREEAGIQAAVTVMGIGAEIRAQDKEAAGQEAVQLDLDQVLVAVQQTRVQLDQGQVVAQQEMVQVEPALVVIKVEWKVVQAMLTKADQEVVTKVE